MEKVKLVPQFYCLNCTSCRYTDEECICTCKGNNKVYIRPDSITCKHFDCKVYERKD